MDYYLGEIRLFTGDFAPVDWKLCQGQLLNLNSNIILFSILGTRYGGNGVTTFALPDFQGRVAIGAGNGLGLSAYALGQTGGTETVTLQTANLPPHAHNGTAAMNCYSGAGNTDTPYNTYPARLPGTKMYASASNNSTMNILQSTLVTATANTGNAAAVNIIQPVLALTYIICTNGDFPPR